MALTYIPVGFALAILNNVSATRVIVIRKGCLVSTVRTVSQPELVRPKAGCRWFCSRCTVSYATTFTLAIHSQLHFLIGCGRAYAPVAVRALKDKFAAHQDVAFECQIRSSFFGSQYVGAACFFDLENFGWHGPRDLP